MSKDCDSTEAGEEWPGKVEQEQAAAQLVQRIHQNVRLDGVVVTRTLYWCSDCKQEFNFSSVAEHMATIHGLQIVPPSAPPDEAEQGGAAPVVRQRTYRLALPGGGSELRTTYACPLCALESEEKADLVQHSLEVHGIPISLGEEHEAEEPEEAEELETTQEGGGDLEGNVATGGGDSGAPLVQVTRLRLPNGEFRLVCPICERHFEDGDVAGLLQHVAAEHGHAWSSGDGEVQGESDRLDWLHQARHDLWYPRRDELLRRLHVVSLGSFCGVKFSIQRLGLGQAHLPFDWIRTTSAGIVHFLRTDFQDFYSVATQRQVRSAGMKMYRSERHSFWHDDIARPEAREKLQRRIQRFSSLRDDRNDLLFLRSCATTDELAGVEELHATLVERFGAGVGDDGTKDHDGPRCRRVLLAVLVTGQEDFQGPIMHDGLPGVVLYGQPTYDDQTKPESDAFCWAVASSADLALEAAEDCDPAAGFSVASGRFPSVPSAVDLLRGASGVKPMVFCDTGLFTGFEDLRSFEDPGANHVDLAVASVDALSCCGCEPCASV